VASQWAGFVLRKRFAYLLRVSLATLWRSTRPGKCKASPLLRRWGSDMGAALDHLDAVSLLGRSPEALFLVLGFDFMISAIHSLQEWKGRGGPLWRNFGAIAGLYLPHWLGFLLFTVALLLGLWTLALTGIAGWLPFLGAAGPSVSAAALGALIGARLSDTAVSHVMLHRLGYRPNPGLSSTPLYVIEAAFLAVAFQKGLLVDLASAMLGFIGGTLFFVLVLPALRLLRFIAPAWRRAAWVRGQPAPTWALE